MAESEQKTIQSNIPVEGLLAWVKTDILKDTRLAFLTEEKNQPLVKYGALTFLGLYLIFGYAAQFICNIVATAYPVYCSIQALESTSSKDDDTRWLTYWVVYAFFTVTESFSDILLSWFPLYWFAKCLFLVWCMLPISWNGSEIIYRQIIRPYFLKNQTQIDETMGKVTGKVEELANHATNMASDAMKND